jgi:hypothetical protein
MDDWGALLERRFSPAEAERLSGVSTTLQRKWIQLHFGDASDTAWLWKGKVEGGHRRFTWAGVQMLAFVRDITRDIGSDRAEQRFMPVHVQDPGNAHDHIAPVLYRSDFFEVDFRAYGKGDLFLVRSLADGGPRHFLTAVQGGVSRFLSSEWGARAYIYNLSALQRELAARAGDDSSGGEPRSRTGANADQ